MDSSRPDRHRIVVVDDESSIRHGLKIRLDAEPDLQVVGTTATGAEAIELVRQLQPDLVLMDVRLPVMDGFDATAALRRTCPAVPVVLLSLYDDAAARRRAREAGAAAFVSKHDGDGVLVGVLRHQLAGPTPSTPVSPAPPPKETS